LSDDTGSVLPRRRPQATSQWELALPAAYPPLDAPEDL